MKLFFDGRQVKLMLERASSLEDWAVPCKLRVVLGKSLKETWWLVPESGKHHLGLVFIVGEARNIREGVNGDGIICGPHALSWPCIVFQRPVPKGKSSNLSCWRICSGLFWKHLMAKIRQFWNPIVKKGQKWRTNIWNSLASCGIWRTIT